MRAGIITDAIKSINTFLDANQKKEGVLMFFLLILSSILDVFGLASLIPVIMAASEPGYLFKNKYLKDAYNILGFSNETTFLIFLIIAIFLFFLIKNIFTTWINYRQVKFMAKVVINIINSQYERYINMPFWEFMNIGSGKIMNSVLNIPNSFAVGVLRPVFVFFSEIIIIAVIVIGIFLFKPILILILGLVLVPTTYITYKAIKNRSHKLGNRINELKPVSYNISMDSFMGYVEIKLAGKQEDFKTKLLKNQKELQFLEGKAYLYTLLPLKTIEVVAILGVVTIFLYSLLYSSNPKELITIVGLFAAAAYRLMPSVNRLLVALVDLKRNQFAIVNLERYNYAKGPVKENKIEPMRFEKDVRFEDLTFKFPGSNCPTLNKINLVIKKGEKIGIIGSSGSGKTTLMNVLLRFYKENEGGIYVDNECLTDLNVKSWHKIVGYVKQDTFLMEASLKDNITLGENVVDEKRLEDAIEKASLGKFVSSLEKGVETHIGERGSKLSGGQRQRIGIARALYKKTQVIILDEATSALDNETEREVNDAINNLSKTEITIIIIAHRITTLKECDRIIELSNGVVSSEKSYQELIKSVI